MHHGTVTPDIAAGLLALKERIKAAKIPSSKIDETANIAVWNIREFGKVRRTEPAIHYIAEIIGQFDLVALVELRDNLEDLGRVMKYLGDTWRVVYSDWMEDNGGNHERTAFLFDRRAVTHNGLAAEVNGTRVKEGKEWVTQQSFWRAPYMCSFRSGNFDFLTIAMHARWGDSTEARAAELQMLSDWIDTRFASKFVDDHDLIVMGDFNTPKLTDKMFKALVSHGLQIPKPLVNLTVGDRVIGGSNLGEDARYDQILHLPTVPENFTNAGGVLDFYIDDKHIDELFPGKKYTRDKFTYQMSDHMPVWIQIKTDIESFRLNQIIQDSGN
ncbi:endonuclease/exonuclease/phosphatase family protein [Prosthecobacter sp.]|uniref:endonuclease/exonuclease/phosphatase family protein n=1 Tax=Prosthecobacter sp. TaxID=1965333 RepID=UPI00378382E3